MGSNLPQAAVAPPRVIHLTASEIDRRAVCDALLSRVASGDRTAFAALYDHLAAAAYGLAQRVVCNPALAEEITQEAFLQVWSTGHTYDRSRGSAQAWVMTVVHRRAVDVVRHEQSARERLLRAGASSVDPPFDTVWASALQHSESDQVLVALSALTALQRQAIELAYFQGMTCREVAIFLQIPIGTAKGRLLEGVRKLRRALVAADN